MGQKIKEIFTLDTRSLALMRVGLGLMIIYNIATLIPHLDAFFGSQGIYPLVNYYQDSNNFLWSIHALSGNQLYILSLFVLQVFFALLLIVGHKTQLATLASWILGISMEHRIYQIGFGGDQVMNTCLMWGMFLPLGAAFSLDARQQSFQNSSNHQTCSVASMAFVIQVILIYTMAGWQKNHPFWEKDLTAVYFTFMTREFVKPLGSWLVQFPDLLKVLTLFTLLLERWAVLFLLCPWRNSFFRILLIVSFIIFHLLIDLTMDVGWLPYIMLIVWSAFLPSSVWDALFRKRKEPTKEQRPNAYEKKKEKALKYMALVLLVHVICFNVFKLHNAVFKDKWSYPVFFRFTRELNLNQTWTFFIRRPETSTRIYYLDPSFEKPWQNLNMSYPFHLDVIDYRWGKLFWNFQQKKFARFKVFTREWLINDWNKRHPYGPKIIRLRLGHIEEEIVFYGKGRILSEIN